jgi:murein tripeptide amidase MpaA
VYIAPRLNPDGAALAMAENPRYIRSGVRAYPFDEKQPGLHPEDVDLDGRILQMRIPDPNGDWKISSLDPRLMEKRAPEEFGGEYYRLLPEGSIEDYDGYLIKVAPPFQSLDFNRNFPFDWRPEGDQTGAGPYPGSEPEIKAVIDFFVGHPNINIALTYHTFAGLILRPYSTKPDDEMETTDLWVYKMMGELGKGITGYKALSTFHDFKYHPKEVTTGAFDDWLFDYYGIFSFTIELWDLPTRAGVEDRKPIEWFRKHPHEDDQKILNWIDENAGENSYVDWYPHEHPQLGKVELGGWNTMYTWRNPPPAFLGKEVERNLGFSLSLTGMLPHLEIQSLDVTQLGDERYHLNLVVENTGYLPTCTSQQGKKRQAVRPVRAELELPENAELLSGERRSELGHLEGRSNKFSLTFGASPTDNRARREWVIKSPPGSVVKIKILSERAGNIIRDINLE